MDSSIVNLREHMLAKVAVEMDTLATARLHEVLRTCAQATAEGASTQPNARNMVFLGTSVVSGTATAERTSTSSKPRYSSPPKRSVT